jgi:hypothetical protein
MERERERETRQLSLEKRVKFRELSRLKNLCSLAFLNFPPSATKVLIRHFRSVSKDYIQNHERRKEDYVFRGALLRPLISAFEKIDSPEAVRVLADVVKRDRELRGINRLLKEMKGPVDFGDLPLSNLALAKYPGITWDTIEPVLRRGQDIEVGDVLLNIPPINDRKFSAKLTDIMNERVHDPLIGESGIQHFMYVLGRNGYEPAAPVIEKYSDSQNGDVRLHARAALDRLSGKWKERLMERIEELRGNVSNKVADALAGVAPELVEKVEQAEQLQPWDTELGRSAHIAVESLYRLLDPMNYEGRKETMGFFLATSLKALSAKLSELPNTASINSRELMRKA